jgi:hypothetical protein
MAASPLVPVLVGWPAEADVIESGVSYVVDVQGHWVWIAEPCKYLLAAQLAAPSPLPDARGA